MTAYPETRHRRRQAGLQQDGQLLCSKCDAPNDRAPQRYCKACHATYQNRWSAEQRRLAREFRKLFHVKQFGSIET